MALAVTHKVAAGSTSNVASYTSASVAANPGDVLVVVCGQSGTAGSVSTVTATGLTFNSQVEIAQLPTCALHYTRITTAFSGTIRIAFCTAGTGAAWHIFTIQGADVSGTNTAFNSNIATGTNSGAAITMTLPSTPAPNNRVIGGCMHAAQEALTAGTGFTIIGGAGTFGGYANTTEGLAAEFGVNGTTVGFSWATGGPAGHGVAAEVGAAPPPLPPIAVGQAVPQSLVW